MGEALTASVLARAGSVDSYPFPHIVIENALPDDLYRQLLDEFTPLDKYRDGGEFRNRRGPWTMNKPVNNRFNVEPAMVKSQAWLDFIAYHESTAFLDDIAQVFGVRQKGVNRAECRQAGNFPSPEGTEPVLGPHVDGGGIWFVGLLYMGDPQDQEGGDLQLCRWLGERKWMRTNRAAEGATEPVKTIQYAHNRFVGFVNTNDSVHMVSDRKSNEYRRFANILVKNSNVRLGG